MELAGVEELLKASMGLNVLSIGAAAVARAVQDRLAACNLANPHAYLPYLRESPIELQALIELVVVPETWFFRDRHAFATLARLIREDWLPGHPDGVLTLLSLPCSTGEEPYSIAMALLDAAIPAERFRVDAVDISLASIAQAKRGVYRRNSFRHGDLGFRDRHFDVTPDGYRVRANVRRHVCFQQGNLFDAGFLPGEDLYDVIFCRNVLIYFDRPTQDRALAILNRLLRAAGVLFVAPAETALPPGHGMVSTNEPMAFAFRKAGIRAPIPRRPAAPPARTRVPSLGVSPAGRLHLGTRPTFPIAAPPAPLAVPTTAAALDRATRLADEGHFVEAASCCEEDIRRSGPSAMAFYLLGLVRDAIGNHDEARTYYRKALYLDPNHREAQIQLALLMEKQGDTAGAQVLRNRARRLEQRQTSHE